MNTTTAIMPIEPHWLVTDYLPPFLNFCLGVSCFNALLYMTVALAHNCKYKCCDATRWESESGDNGPLSCSDRIKGVMFNCLLWPLSIIFTSWVFFGLHSGRWWGGKAPEAGAKRWGVDAWVGLQKA